MADVRSTLLDPEARQLLRWHVIATIPEGVAKGAEVVGAFDGRFPPVPLSNWRAGVVPGSGMVWAEADAVVAPPAGLGPTEGVPGYAVVHPDGTVFFAEQFEQPVRFGLGLPITFPLRLGVG